MSAFSVLFGRLLFQPIDQEADKGLARKERKETLDQRVGYALEYAEKHDHRDREDEHGDRASYEYFIERVHFPSSSRLVTSSSSV